jgi:hypothetical protein
MIGVSNQFPSFIENSLMLDDIELLHVSIDRQFAHTINFVTIYRPPSSSFQSFLDYFSNFLNNIDYINSSIVLVGDLNVDMLKYSAQKKLFLNTLKEYGMFVVNSVTPTRVGNSSSTLLDIVICNKKAAEFILHHSVLPIAYSDHQKKGAI